MEVLQSKTSISPFPMGSGTLNIYEIVGYEMGSVLSPFSIIFAKKETEMNIAPDMGNSAITTPSAPSPSRKVSLQTFLEKYSQREDGYRYEYDNGQVIKTKTTMSDLQQFIANNLIRFFYRLEIQGIVKGNLVAKRRLGFPSQLGESQIYAT
jgi:hypothetical protein